MMCVHCGLHIEPATPIGESEWRHTVTGWRPCYFDTDHHAEPAPDADTATGEVPF